VDLLLSRADDPHAFDTDLKVLVNLFRDFFPRIRSTDDLDSQIRDNGPTVFVPYGFVARPSVARHIRDIGAALAIDLICKVEESFHDRATNLSRIAVTSQPDQKDSGRQLLSRARWRKLHDPAIHDLVQKFLGWPLDN
jgi:hypothetical protein